MRSEKVSRREFLKATGMGGAALLFGQHVHAAGSLDAFTPDAILSLNATDKRMQILPGAQTRVYNYEGQLTGGSGVDVQAIPDSYLGPILRVKSGTKLRILFRNNLIEKSIIHPHRSGPNKGL
jgi:FtsP/CotA-like multicopper oxidase with cupredoxin domain